MQKIWENNGTEEIGLVTPTPAAQANDVIQSNMKTEKLFRMHNSWTRQSTLNVYNVIVKAVTKKPSGTIFITTMWWLIHMDALHQDFAYKCRFWISPIQVWKTLV